MPELPEVETILRELRPRLRGRRMNSVEVLHRRIVRHSSEDLSRTLGGHRIRDITRHGKFLIVEHDAGSFSIHLGMTGKLLFDGELSPYTRAVFQLEDAVLLYDDVRMFGSIESGCARVNRLGPDALNSGGWHQRLLGRKTTIKAALLNQHAVAGIGNIYSDEALFRARLHPARRASEIGRSRARTLEAVTRQLLEEAVEFRGSSISDYVDTTGRTGGFQNRHQVYGREGKPCPRCGTLVKRAIIAQRSAHFCPKCQKFKPVRTD